MADPDEILLTADEKMDSAIEAFRRELNGIRTGRAHPFHRAGAPGAGARAARPDPDVHRSPRSTRPERARYFRWGSTPNPGRSLHSCTSHSDFVALTPQNRR